MRFSLLAFQQQTVETALTELRLSMDEIARVGGSSNGQAITLTAPTGAGKTVMAAAVLESLIFGDESVAGDDQLTVVWLSDLPNVNDQTRKKIARASDRLSDDLLVQIDTTFKADELAPGTVYFLNTQKLSATSNLVADSEDRSFTIWEVINRTIARNPSRFLLVIDEAHRGMERTTAAQADSANTIVQRFILGSDDMVRSPIILGISATPKRFDELIGGTRRTVRRAEADIAEVRASGLIKERIVVWRPEHGLAHSESTLLQRAAQSLHDYQLRWSRYATSEHLTEIAPIMVVQVEDRRGTSITATDLNQAIDTIEEVTGPLHPDSFAHCFGDAPASIVVGSRRIRYVRPSEIDADSQVIVVFFKTSLSTGWDCPRAEVIMSYRSAKDATFIAQLVGRMVRTPLARRVDSDEVLNSVALYLPRYDRRAVQNIVKQLRAGDPDFLPALDAEEGNGLVSCERVENLYSLIEERARSLVSYSVPRAHRMAPVTRLERLAGALSDYDLLQDAPSLIDSELVGILWARLAARRTEAQFEIAVDQARKVGLNATSLSYLTGQTEVTSIQVKSTSRSIERLFEQVGGRIGAGLQDKLWRRIRAEEAGTDGDRARLMSIAVLAEAATVTAVENAARDRFDGWIRQYQSQIDALSESERYDFDKLREQADEPTIKSLALPQTVRGRRNAHSTDWPDHLYQDTDGNYPEVLNDWERDVVEAELAKPELICWVRNKERQNWALTVPYDAGDGAFSRMYPDFIFFRRSGQEIVADIVDPHGLHLDDAPAKARALAKYAQTHAGLFGRIEMVIYDKLTNRRKSLDLNSSTIRRHVLNVTTTQHLSALFDLAGS